MNDLRDLQQEHRTTRSDAEGMLKVMEGMEKNLAEYKSREEQVCSITSDKQDNKRYTLYLKHNSPTFSSNFKTHAHTLSYHNADVNIARESKEKVEQAMLERDQALAREAQGRREIARLLEQRRVQANEAMDHEEASIEAAKKRLSDQLMAAR